MTWLSYYYSLFKTVESGEEAKMEPTCETQTEQPSSLMVPIDPEPTDQVPSEQLSTNQTSVDQPAPQQGKHDLHRTVYMDLVK